MRSKLHRIRTAFLIGHKYREQKRTLEVYDWRHSLWVSRVLPFTRVNKCFAGHLNSSVFSQLKKSIVKRHLLKRVLKREMKQVLCLSYVTNEQSCCNTAVQKKKTLKQSFDFIYSDCTRKCQTNEVFCYRNWAQILEDPNLLSISGVL